MSKLRDDFLKEISNYYGEDAKAALLEAPDALNDLLKDIKKIDLTNPAKQVEDCETKLNQMLLGVVNPRQTGGYETSPILRVAALLQGNPNAINEQNPLPN